VSNVLKVIDQQTIRSLHERGWSGRRIARELGLNRRTVSRYVKVISPGSGQQPDSKCTISTPGSGEGSQPKCAISSPGKAGRRSQCEGYRNVIVAKVEDGLSAQRIYQDLRQEAGFDCSYQSVKRFVSAIREAQPQRVWRMECQPGEEMQVDFGLGASIQDGNRTRRSWVFRVVLSYSRKGYSEAVYQQNTETFLRFAILEARHFF
jgi:transposase